MLSILFMGTPDFAKESLQALYNANYNIIGVVTNPDKPKGRGMKMIPSPVKEFALENKIPVYQPLKVKNNTEFIEEVKALNPDVICVVAYGKILPKEILDIPRLGCINVHGSLLPKLRGGAPIHHAIINGEKETGITIMYMDKAMDSGDIISQKVLPILPEDNLDTLYEKMSLLGANLLQETLPDIIAGKNNRIKQDEKLVTFGYNITKEEEKINFNNSSLEIHNQIRGLSSIPGAYCYLDEKRLKIYASTLTNDKSKDTPGTISKIDKTGIYLSTKDNLLKITDIKLEGKKRCLVSDFVNGIKINDYLGKVLK